MPAEAPAAVASTAATSPPPIIRTKVSPRPTRPTSRRCSRLDLEIRSGEIYGLLGPNGAGKTTTIGMLTTRVIPTSGQAFVGGVDMIRHPALAKQVIGVVPQTNTLDRAMTVEENLFFHGRYFGMSGEGGQGGRRRACSTGSASPTGPRRRSWPSRAAWRSG